MTEERKKTNKVLAPIVVILLVAIAILLWLLLKPMPEPDKIETGNVDVFDIRIGCLCKGEDGEECDDGDGKKDEDGFVPGVTPGASGSSSYSEGKINGKTNDGADSDTDVDEDGIIYVDDKNGRYAYQKNLKIFENAAFQYTSKIAPGVSNSYNFKVHNATENTVRYNIEFAEKSEYSINMLYRLKREGGYIVGSDTEWVKAEDLVSALKLLSNDEVDSYTLDWKWPYDGGTDADDTKAGEEMTSEYKLGIKINFEEV